MTSRGRSFTHASEWDMREDYNDSIYETQYADDSQSVNANLDHCRLYITNIPRGLNDEGLRTAFSKFGTLVEVYLSRDPLKKYGLLRYETPGEAKLAMMKMNKTEPLKLNINIAHKASKKGDDRQRKDYQNRSLNNNTGRDRNSNKDETASIDSKGRGSRAQDTALTETMTNGDNNTDELLEDDYGFSDILDPKLTLELETLKMEQLKVKEEQLQCKSRMIMLKRQEKRPMSHSGASNRCILPDGKIIFRNVADRSAADLDVNHSAGAGDSPVPGLLQIRSRACVTCSEQADLYCSNCGVTPYCSTRCQIKDWPGRHRAVCHNLVRLAEQASVPTAAVDLEPVIQNPAPLRRPHAVTEHRREQSRNGDEGTDTRVSDTSERFRRLQERTSQSNHPSQNQDRRQSGSGRGRLTEIRYYDKRNYQKAHRNFTPYQDEKQQRSFKQKTVEELDTTDGDKKAEVKPAVKFDIHDKPKPEVKSSPMKASASTSVPVPQTPQMNGKAPTVKPGTLGDVTPTRKVIPKNYLIEQLAIGDTLLLSVDAKASECRTTVGDYVCLSMHGKFETDYQSLCEDYVLVCDADHNELKLTPGETCSYFNVEDGGWYRARCLDATSLALIDGSKVVAVAATDKVRALPPKYEQVPEFSCVLECKNVEIGSNLKCSLVSKSGDGYKVTLQDVETGSSVGDGVVTRWVPTVEYVAAKPVIPEVPRPPLRNNSSVLLVDATALDRVFVRPADTQCQREYDDVVQNVLLAGRKATSLKEPPVMGQTVIAKFTDGLHYRALCKRTHIVQKKYLLEYIDFGNLDICRNLEDLFPCPPNLELAAAPTQVSMIKWASEGGEFTPPAAEYVEKLKDSNDEMILTLASAATSAPSGSEAILKLSKNSENVNKKIIEMCTPDWKKFQEKGGDVVDMDSLTYEDLEYQTLPSGPVELTVLDFSVLQGGMFSGYVKGDPHAEYVFTHVTKKMAEYCNSEIGREPYLPKAEELCIAQCPPYAQWFRAVLLEQGAGRAAARVFYVDYGNVEHVPVALLRKMLPEFVRGVPVVGSQFEIEGFPKDPSAEQLSRAVAALRPDADGRGTLSARRVLRSDPGLHRVHAPELIEAMLQ